MVGYEPVVTPYWFHNVMWSVVNCVPESMASSIRLSQSISIRKRALKKKAAKAAEDKKQ